MKFIKAFESWTNKGNISFDVITNFSEMPQNIKWITDKFIFDKYFSKYGSFILITCNEHPKGCYLGQKRGESWVFFNDKNSGVTIEQIASDLKMETSELEKTLLDLI
jgi:hypothetical protein